MRLASALKPDDPAPSGVETEEEPQMQPTRREREVVKDRTPAVPQVTACRKSGHSFATQQQEVVLVLAG